MSIPDDVREELLALRGPVKLAAMEMEARVYRERCARLARCLENVLVYLERHEPQHGGEKLWRRRARAALRDAAPPAGGAAGEEP